MLRPINLIIVAALVIIPLGDAFSASARPIFESARLPGSSDQAHASSLQGLNLFSAAPTSPEEFYHWMDSLVSADLDTELVVPAATSTGSSAAGQGRLNQERAKPPFKTVITADGREAIAGRVVVGFHQGVEATRAEDIHRAVVSSGVAEARVVGAVGPTAQLVEVPSAGTLEEILAIYRSDPRVKYAELDYLVSIPELADTRTPEMPLFSPAGVPNDPYLGLQWGVNRIEAPAAWDVTQGSPETYIAILDSGVNETHQDLLGKVKLSQNFTDEPDTNDRYGHGTHVAGIAAAIANNGIGVAGIGYNARLYNAKVLREGFGFTTWVTQAIYWATDNGARVINMSLVPLGAIPEYLAEAINYAWDHNVVIVVAAGNNGTDSPVWPGSGVNVVAVAAVDESDERASFSNYGTWVDVAAPGVSILSTYLGESGYIQMSGTSMAAPFVSGLAGLLWSTDWGVDARTVVQRMKSTANHVSGTGALWEAGRINAALAVAHAFLIPTPTSTATPAVVATATGTATPTGIPPRPASYWIGNRTAIKLFLPITVYGGMVVNYDWEAVRYLKDVSSGDASKALFGELLTTKLNIGAGASHSCIDLVVSQAETFLKANPYGSNPQGAVREEVLALKGSLEGFNNQGCDKFPLLTSTPTAAANTATATPTNTPTATVTGTPTPTSTPTMTSTSTPTLTATPAVVATATGTATPAVVATATGTATPAVVATATGTATPTGIPPRPASYWIGNRTAIKLFLPITVYGGMVVNYDWEAVRYLKDVSSGDASKALFGELLTTKLNIGAGASHSCIDLVVSQAETFLKANPYGSNPQGAVREEALALKGSLEGFNNQGCH